MVKQISIFVSNEKGGMSKITKMLAENKIDIRALSIADTVDYGVLRLIVDRPEDALACLKNQGVTATLTDVIAVSVPDVPGGLHKIMDALANEGVDIDYIYAFLHPQKEQACVIIRTGEDNKAVAALAGHGISVIESGEIYSI